jgi:hypothetical protein
MKTLNEIKVVLSAHREELSDRFRVRKMGVFGSYARGEQKRGSDLDVLVEFDEPVSLLGLAKVENFLGDILGVTVDVVPKKDIRPELRKRILAETVFV